jgi:hypothetical protein
VAGAGFLLALGAPPASASVITLNPTADALVSSANPSSNYGAAGGLSVAAAGMAKGEFQSVMMFDASSAMSSFDATYGAGKWTIKAVSLQLTAAAPSNPIFNSPSAAGEFSVLWIPDDSWTEGTGKPSSPGTAGVTFNAMPSLAGAEAVGTFSFDGATSGQAAYGFTLASGLLADLAAGHAVSLDLSAADSAASYVFNSREFGTAASRPVLSITATPEPATLALLAAGTALLVRNRRKGRS